MESLIPKRDIWMFYLFYYLFYYFALQVKSIHKIKKRKYEASEPRS